MADLPILFSAPMVRALLDGRKTQTRRALKLRGHKSFSQFGPSDTLGYNWHFRDAGKRWHDFRHEGLLNRLPYRVGDRLYVREHWRSEAISDQYPPRDLMAGQVGLHFEADGEAPDWAGRHRQGMHMPRWASRITLLVTEVRVERLQDCSAADAKAEGVVHNNVVDRRAPLPVWSIPGTDAGGRNAVEAYAALWERINGHGAWMKNPWVAAISFTVSRSNIDQMPEVGE